jgi:hypothetical protein
MSVKTELAALVPGLARKRGGQHVANWVWYKKGRCSSASERILSSRVNSFAQIKPSCEPFGAPKAVHHSSTKHDGLHFGRFGSFGRNEAASPQLNLLTTFTLLDSFAAMYFRLPRGRSRVVLKRY